MAARDPSVRLIVNVSPYWIVTPRAPAAYFWSANTIRKSMLIENDVMPNLEKLQQDDDVDVRYFATTAAQSYGGGNMEAMSTSP